MMPGNAIVKGMVVRLATTGFVREALAEKVDLKAILFDNLFDFEGIVFEGSKYGGLFLLVKGYYASKSRDW
ncbi:MAG: hypothetical protein NTY86_14905 [Deltaproteobacteria bacterium]|nr:hypothetical protein [Deltaproteobacteria bacterium]